MSFRETFKNIFGDQLEENDEEKDHKKWARIADLEYQLTKGAKLSPAEEEELKRLKEEGGSNLHK